MRKLCGPELGYIFQSAGSAFCPIRTVGAQLYEAMREHGKISKALFEERALEMLAKLGFEDGKRILTSYPFELSGGMQQRVGIAAAMLLRPRLKDGKTVEYGKTGDVLVNPQADYTRALLAAVPRLRR